jgi:hypothetical protein
MANFRKGAEAVAKSTEKKSGGSFRTYTPTIYWPGDNDQRYLLFLNPMDEIVTADMVRYIPQEFKGRDGEIHETFEEVIARTDDSIGESVDPMVRDWDGAAKPHGIAVAVELEPTFEEVNGRDKIVGLEVKTSTFERRIRDEDGDLTDDTEEVTKPEVGIITQSTYNFFNVVTSFDANDYPIDSCPVKITRVGSDSSTTYTIQGYDGINVDLAPLVDYVEGISYLNDEMDELLKLVDDAETLEDAARVIGETILNKRLDELVDEERYDKLYESIDKSLDRFGNKNKKKGDKPAKKAAPRRSQRRTAAAEDEPAAEKPKRATRAKRDAAPESKQNDPEALSKLDELKARQKARNAA